MKKLALILAGTLILFTLACRQQPSSPSSSGESAAVSNAPQAFTGEIVDSMCAQEGSHEQMLSPKGPRNARECTLDCVKMGAKFVLYNHATRTIYQLDDQKKPEGFAGERVKVIGRYDRDQDDPR